jgi:hypothetical protein
LSNIAAILSASRVLEIGAWAKLPPFNRSARDGHLAAMFTLTGLLLQRSCEAEEQVGRRRLHLAEVSA